MADGDTPPEATPPGSQAPPPPLPPPPPPPSNPTATLNSDAPSAIFTDDEGFPVKFFLQKDLDCHVLTDLRKAIPAMGGRVEPKVPRQGFIVVMPGSDEEARLRLCWQSEDRPGRFFVPYTWVEECAVAGKLLKQIFVSKGVPMKLHIHSSVANVNSRIALSRRIIHSGGNPAATFETADVILADPSTEVFSTLVRSCEGSFDKRVESFTWVKSCIDRGVLEFTPVVYKNPGGRRAGEERTSFTTEDERHLCEWIALKIPYKETGGRTGNKLYQQLIDKAGDPDYTWVTRHTWQSWRERYKKNFARLDPIIADIVSHLNLPMGGQGQYGYVRQKARGSKKPAKRRTVPTVKRRASGNGEGSDTESDASDVLNASASMTQPMPVSMLGPIPPMMPFSPQHAGSIFIPPPIHLQPPLASTQPLTRQRSPTKDAADDLSLLDSESQWQIRIGNQPPPAWSKRKAPHDGQLDDDGARKRQRTDETGSSPSSELSPVETVLGNIAREFRFTQAEVRQFHESCQGSDEARMERTKARFKDMRQLLTQRFPLNTEG